MNWLGVLLFACGVAVLVVIAYVALLIGLLARTFLDVSAGEHPS